MRLPDLLVPRPVARPGDGDGPVPGVRRRAAVAVTLVVGTALLAATLAAPQGSGAFTALGFAVAATWVVGSVASGPLPLGHAHRGAELGLRVVEPALLGAVAFGAFLVTSRVARHLPVLSGALDRVLDRADAGTLGVVLAVALVNAAGEELFFRGAVVESLPPGRAAAGATVLYVLVTVVTLNAALVVAAAVMGTLFMIERLSTGTLRAPMLTHMVWSTLMVLALPR